MLKIEKINKTDLDLKVSEQVCSGCLTDCQSTSWVGNRSEASGCTKVTICNPRYSPLM